MCPPAGLLCTAQLRGRHSPHAARPTQLHIGQGLPAAPLPYSLSLPVPLMALADYFHTTTFDSSQEGSQDEIRNGYMGIIFAFVLSHHYSHLVVVVGGSGVRQTWVPVQALPFTSPGPWINHLSSLCLSFFICIMESQQPAQKVTRRMGECVQPIPAQHSVAGLW